METINSSVTSADLLSSFKEEENRLWILLEQVTDPEVPVLSILDLGLVREIEVRKQPLPANGNEVHVTITPTYSGCPAMDVITMNIRFALLQAGFKKIFVHAKLSPAWTTDWMTEAGKQKLKSYGIAPPLVKQAACTPEPFQQEQIIQCPRCNSSQTQLISQFASTACKALYKCLDCHEPFDYFKCH